MRYWLFKSEPSAFSIDDLNKRPKQTEHWDGVRNFQARNFLRDEIKEGDQGFFYHSSCTPPGIVGIVEVVKEGYPDFTAWDKSAAHYDPQSPEHSPRWFMVDVKLVKKFKRMITLDEIKLEPTLKNMIILKKGNRLSITPVAVTEWKVIMEMSKE